jgi:hypothetical protein
VAESWRPHGLCETCRWRRDVTTGRSSFVLCTRGLDDPAYPKYPRLPVMECPGYQPVGALEPGGDPPH